MTDEPLFCMILGVTSFEKYKLLGQTIISFDISMSLIPKFYHRPFHNVEYLYEGIVEYVSTIWYKRLYSQMKCIKLSDCSIVMKSNGLVLDCVADSIIRPMMLYEYNIKNIDIGFKQ